MSRSDTAYEAAIAGSEIAHERFRTDLDIATKNSKMDFVTEADTETQHRVIEVVRDAYPDATIVGEEEDELKSVPEDGNAWVIDPIDGTTNFVRGVPLWTTTVAAVRDHETVAAVTVAPALGETFVADSTDATLNDEPISVSDQADLERFVVAPILRYGSERDRQFGTLLRESILEFGDLRRFGCAQVTLAMVARGTLDAAVSPQPEPNPWDTIAGIALVERAGGVVTDLEGNPWKPGCEGLVASNGSVHAEIVERVRAAVA
ncbi:inositol monophosphatase family protein [Natrialba taiwanensis]|uniref:fructose-bisphosphatase n=1 Tax=Natrialba taiwanensis DSM 12281 TaxID=1230458 RepID=M0A4K6_9EURY|nr:inositol monophosphatase [Natrialba taiwanensis]ELY92283.1 inositol-1(or 4)-monophosphatase / fructose-1,6-bisphosphatase [Natrialba taiwanensis DSM 12281]